MVMVSKKTMQKEGETLLVLKENLGKHIALYR